MERRKIQIALWAVLFILQAFLAGLLTLGLVTQSRTEPAQLQSFDLSKVYSSRLAEKGQLSVDDQNKLLALCKDYEQKIFAHIKFEGSMLNELRGFYGQLLLFLGIALVVQIALATLSLKAPGPSIGK